jgi:hypothetical protein
VSIGFFFEIWTFLKMAFLCVSQQGDFKNTTKPFWKKSMSEALYFLQKS